MRNRRAIAAVVSSSLLLCLAMIACSSDDTKSTFTDSQPDAAFDTGPGFATDANQTTQDAAVTCDPSLPTDFSPTWNPPAAPTSPSPCTTQQVSDYFDHCIALDANQQSQFNTKTCTDWIAQAGTCGSCIEDPTAKNSGPIQPFNNRGYFGLNNAGCIAIEQNNFATGSCGQTYDALTQCLRDSCNDCFSVAGATFSDFTTCESKALSTGCAETNANSQTPCEGYKDAGADAGAYDCFPIGTESSNSTSFYERLIGIFCVAPN